MPLKKINPPKLKKPALKPKSKHDSKGEYLANSFLNIKDYVEAIDIPSELKNHILVSLDDWYEWHKNDKYFWEANAIPKRIHYPPVPNRDAVVSVGDACFYITEYMESLEMPELMISQLEGIIEDMERIHDTDDFDWIDA